MALLVVRQGARRAAPLMAVRGGSAVSVRRMGSTMRQPFKRSPAPAEPLHEEHELVWDDGVAPEVCLDFDAPYISKSLGLKMFLGGFLFFGSIYGFAALQPYGTKQAVRSIDICPLCPGLQPLSALSALSIVWKELTITAFFFCRLKLLNNSIQS